MKIELATAIEDFALRAAGDAMFVVGKGSSLDQINRSAFATGLTININDSFLLHAGDVCLFHREWVLDKLDPSHAHDIHFITSSSEAARRLPRCSVTSRVRWTQASREGIVERFCAPGFELEDVLLLSALKLARAIGERRGRKQRVYLVGFDFWEGDGAFAGGMGGDRSSAHRAFQRSFIASQEFALVMLMEFCRSERTVPLEIVHVGAKVYSELSVHHFNQAFRTSELRFIPPRSSPGPSHTADGGRGSKASQIQVVAELTTNHLGDRARLLRMTDLAHAAGANAVKVQKRNVETFYSQAQLDGFYASPFGTTLRDYRKAIELSVDDLRALDARARELGIAWFASVLDWPSFEIIRQFDPVMVKLPSTISEHRTFLRRVADAWRGPIVVSTGFTTAEYEAFVLHTFRKNDAVFMLQATSAYPTPHYECNVAVVRHYAELSRSDPRIKPGYSSHDAGALGSMLATAAGAVMIEKHVKVGNTPWVHFDEVALDLETEFPQFVADVRLAEEICGSGVKRAAKTEHHKYWPLDWPTHLAGHVSAADTAAASLGGDDSTS